MIIVNGLGGMGARMSCHECGTDLKRDPKTGNYLCPKPGCGKGGIVSNEGIITTVDTNGNIVLRCGEKPS